MPFKTVTKAPSCAGRFVDAANKFLVLQLRERGITDILPSHGDLLVQLFGGRSLTVSDLARTCGRTKSTVSVLAGKLDAAGYLIREPDTYDARILRLRLTEKGEALQPVFEEISAEMTGKLEKEFGSEVLSALESLLERATKVF